ncbi:MAG: tyrosine-type recombinase/integrase [Rhodospirillaceae bacterium]|nr:tyrosine-type recombinase/integrase [Rhodospirillaceae bacterium]MDD9997957.1 tyrosine-type recombinase/integrase [Rhodospirillaceae bacterium]MDE0360701.1 tyrosine-type recombinase/integrase [Rhodospirillaceae bacterium]
MPRTSKMRITKRTVDALQVRAKDYVAWDRDLAGFGVRVLPSARKVFVVQSRGPAGSKRVSLGPYGKLSPAEARQRAARMIRRIKQGQDPKSEPASREPTVADLAARYLRVDASVNCKPATLAHYRSIVDNHIVPAMGEFKVSEVNRADVAALHFSLRDTPGMANCTLQVLSQLFRTAERWGMAAPGQSPCRSHPKFRLRARERYLTPKEYRRLGRVLSDGAEDGSLSESAVAALQLLILTGCRRDEILKLRWEDVDFEAGEVHLRDTKTGPCCVALTSAVKRVLTDVPRLPGNPWVIVGARPGRRLMTLKSTWRRVRQRAGLGDVRLHDLRHSYASRALAVGESLSMIGKLLNHVQLASAARYAHLMREAERNAAARIGDRIGARLLRRDGIPDSSGERVRRGAE